MQLTNENLHFKEQIYKMLSGVNKTEFFTVLRIFFPKDRL